MTLQECTALLTPFALALRADVDDPTFRAYHRVLEDVPAALLEAALVTESRKPELRFLPTAPQLLGACELARRRILALHPWSACSECEDSPRFRPVLVEGKAYVQKCPCVDRHRQRLAFMGVGDPICALPSTASEGPAEQDYPTREQLPADMRDRLDTVVSQRRMR